MQQPISARNNKVTVLLFVLGAFIFLYTASRAYLLSITWDEAFTYLEFVRNKIVIPDKYVKMSANNHLLNTLLEIYFVKWFGVSEFVLRLPSLLSHLLFLFFSAKLLKDFENKWFVIAAFILINLNPYLLDFFSLARGYGLSLGLMMASIYYLYELQTRNTTAFAIRSIVFAVLAVVANFVMLNYCLVLFGIIVLVMADNAMKLKCSLKEKIFYFLKNCSIPAIIMGVLLATALPVLFKLKEAGALFFGGYQSFWADTICETIDRNCYDIPYNLLTQRIARTFMLFVLISATGFIGYKHYKQQKTNDTRFLGSLVLLIVMCSLSTIVEHYLFKTPFLAHRMTLYLLVLFNLIAVFFINEVIKKWQQVAMLSYFLVAAIVVHFTLSCNFRFVLDWKFDADTKLMLSDLDKIYREKKDKKKIVLGDTFWFFQSINFYRDTQKLDWISIQTSKEKNQEQPDYLFLTEAEFLCLDKSSVEIIKTYPLTKNTLVKNKNSSQLK